MRKLLLSVAFGAVLAASSAVSQTYTPSANDTLRIQDRALQDHRVNAQTYIQTLAGSGGAAATLTGANVFTSAGSNTFNGAFTLSPGSGKAVAIDPTTAGTIDNMALGSITPSTGVFTTLSATTFDSTPVGSITPSTGAFTTLAASSTVSGTGFSTYLASPPAIGGSAAAAGSFTTLTATGAFTASPANLNDVLSPTGTGVVTINPATAGTVNNMSLGATTASTVKGTTVNATTSYLLNGNLALSPTAPTIANGGGLGTVGTITGSAAAFDVTAGTGAGSVFVITLPAATNGWVCNGADITTASTTVFLVKQTVGTNNATTVTMGNYNDTGSLAAVGTADHLRISCTAY